MARASLALHTAKTTLIIVIPQSEGGGGLIGWRRRKYHSPAQARPAANSAEIAWLLARGPGNHGDAGSKLSSGTL